MERKICTQCNIGKYFENSYNIYTERKTCTSSRSFKRYYEIKDKYKFKKIYILKKKEKFLQKQHNRYINYKKLLRSCDELENKLKTWEEKIKRNESENN